MAYITLQFGQCGNQLGEELYSFAFEDAYNIDSWFNHTPNGHLKARSVFLDAEKKVLYKLPKKGSWSYNMSNVVSENTGGSGNNFAQGYCATGPRVCEAMMEALRRECERCDRVGGLISLAACAGGTGSGAGTYVLEHSRDYYPNKSLISVLIMPYLNGDVVTQNNNILFTLSKQSDICDGIVLFENELVNSICQQQSRLKNTKLKDLNRIISQSVLSFLQPINSSSYSIDLYDLISQVTTLPSYKLLSVLSFPVFKELTIQTDYSPSWNVLEREIVRTFKTSLRNVKLEIVNSISNIVISRGQQTPDTTFRKLKTLFMYPRWIPSDRQLHIYHQHRPLLKQEKCLTLISNNSQVTRTLDHYISKAWRLFTNSMYVHHYYKFGFSKEMFVEAFTKAETILKNYNNLDL